MILEIGALQDILCQIYKCQKIDSKPFLSTMGLPMSFSTSEGRLHRTANKDPRGLLFKLFWKLWRFSCFPENADTCLKGLIRKETLGATVCWVQLFSAPTGDLNILENRLRLRHSGTLVALYSLWNKQQTWSRKLRNSIQFRRQLTSLTVALKPGDGPLSL